MSRLKGFEIEGLPDRWPELIAEALSELSDEEFDRAWKHLGEVVRAMSRVRRAEAVLDDARGAWDMAPGHGGWS